MAEDTKKSRLIGQILLDEGLVTSQQLEEALAARKESGGYICTIVAKLGLANHRDIIRVLAEKLGVDYVELDREKIDPRAIEKVPVKLALHYELMPYRFEGNTLTVALVDPLDIHILDDLKLLLNTEIKAVLGFEGDILESIQKHYGVGAEIIEEIMARGDLEGKVRVRDHVAEDIETAVEDASIVKFVNQIFTQAVEDRATDIHLEPFENELRMRFRIDGFLYEIPIPESLRLFHQSIVSRVKIMAALDIAEHRLPQDGRIKIRSRGEEYDMRVSIVPSSFGESVQIRILSSQAFLGLEHLGLFEDDRKKIESLIHKPHGIIFATGPTGSGKSTTLYACLSKKNTHDTKILTVEDPIEYQMRGVTQMQVHPKIGFTFAEGLRCILRHDPDIIMVGEVRDVETAEITIRAAMTGHLVFSTLHTNDAASAPTRLVDMGIEPFLVASSLEGIVAQRLVRLLCPDCKEKESISPQIIREAGLAVEGQGQCEVFKAKGCQKCRFTGFRGRTAIFEILLVGDEIRDLIFQKVTSQTIKEKALSLGMQTLRQNGLRKVLAGVTALSEVMRVT